MNKVEETKTEHGRLEDLESLLETIEEMEGRGGEGPHLTLYCEAGELPTDAEKAAIRFKNLMADAEGRLEQLGVGQEELEEWFNPLRKIAGDREFWNHQRGGVAVFGRPGALWIYEVCVEVESAVEVRSKFWLKPLMAAAANANQYYLLCLSQAKATLYRGGGFGVSEVECPTMPDGYQGAMEKLGYDADSKAMVGAESRLKVDKRYLKQYFEQVDEAVRLGIAKNGVAAPLLLAAVAEYAPLYQEVNQYSALSDEVISGAPDREDVRRLAGRAREVLSRELDESRREGLRLFSDANSGPDEHKLEGLEEVLEAAEHGRIATLFVPADASCWGRYDADEKDRVVLEEKGGEVDLYELAARKTLNTGGEVYFLDQIKLPTDSKVVGIARWETEAVGS